MTSLWPGGPCEFCEPQPDRPFEPVRHHKCIGWALRGYDFCGCAKGICLLRLVTGVMWDVIEPPNDNQGDP